MIREYGLWVSEALFYMTGGEPIINTHWIVLWVLLGTLVTVLPIICAVIWPTVTSGLIALFLFFFGLQTVTGPGIVQTNLMSECRTDVLNLNGTEYTLNQCRYKQNYYGEFGDWRYTGFVK